MEYGATVGTAPNADGASVVVLTGGASGIGRATAARFIDEGWNVAILDIDGLGARKAAEDLGPSAVGFGVDVADFGALKSALGDVANTFGRVDALVNNATVVGDSPVEEQDEALWDRVMSVGAEAALHATRILLPSLSVSPAPSITNVASIVAFQGEAGVASYCAAKGALVSLTRALAVELADRGIRVNCVCPGVTDTPQTSRGLAASPDPTAALSNMLRRVPQRRLIGAGEVADVIHFLASKRASAVTGSTVVVDAGLTAGWR